MAILQVRKSRHGEGNRALGAHAHVSRGAQSQGQVLWPRSLSTPFGLGAHTLPVLCLGFSPVVLFLLSSCFPVTVFRPLYHASGSHL